jgi:hypothetical protein
MVYIKKLLPTKQVEVEIKIKTNILAMRNYVILIYRTNIFPSDGKISGY